MPRRQSKARRRKKKLKQGLRKIDPLTRNDAPSMKAPKQSRSEKFFSKWIQGDSKPRAKKRKRQEGDGGGDKKTLGQRQNESFANFEKRLEDRNRDIISHSVRKTSRRSEKLNNAGQTAAPE